MTSAGPIVVKREGEGFSDLARRLAAEAAGRDFWDMDLRLDMDEEEATRKKGRIRAFRHDPRNERL